MEIKKVGIGSPVVIDGVRLVPIVRTTIGYWQKDGMVSFLGTKRPVSLLAISLSTRVAFAIAGEQVDVKWLIEEVPDIKTVIE